jgi:hypothetical protein
VIEPGAIAAIIGIIVSGLLLAERRKYVATLRASGDRVGALERRCDGFGRQMIETARKVGALEERGENQAREIREQAAELETVRGLEARCQGEVRRLEAEIERLRVA